MNIIFHHPMPLNYNSDSASGIRPVKMLEAFKSLGYDVDVIAGYSSERKRAIIEIKSKIESGVKYEFMYAENSTQPTTLTDKHHLPLHPWMDASFFYFCKKNNIPIGLFYRDIYWEFDAYGRNLNFWKVLGARLAYYYDLLIYKKTLLKLYLPSKQMGKFMPVLPAALFDELPPGHSSCALVDKIKINKPLKIFYVGGISDHYRMHTLFETLKDVSEVELTVCTRADEWQAVSKEYQPLSDNIKIIHEYGASMERYLEECDIASVFVEPYGPWKEYWSFTYPVKLFHYMGFEKPIMAANGTLAGDFVKDNAIGWSLPYTKEALIDFFKMIAKDVGTLHRVHQNLALVAPQHTWRARAAKVAKDLTN